MNRSEQQHDQDPAPGRRRLPAWPVGLAVLAVAVLVLALLLPGSPDDDSAPDRPPIEPLPVNLKHSSGVGDPISEARRHGLEYYRDGRYEDAVPELREAVTGGEIELWLYLGSALALVNETWEAKLILERVANLAGQDDLRDRALWQLASAQLVDGDVPAAQATLVRVQNVGGAHATAAAELLTTLD